MKIIFTRAPSSDGTCYSAEGRCQQPLKASYDILLPPLSSMYAAAMLERIGDDVKILDFQANWTPPYKFLEKISESNPDFLFFQSGVHTINSDILLAEKIKEENPTIKIAFFDVFPTIMHESIICKKGVDFVIRGEPEEIIIEIINKAKKGEDLTNVLGTTVIVDGKKKVNEDRPRISNLDTLEYPARNLININDYIQPFTEEPYQPIQTNRGCPHRCIFCIATKYYGQKPVFRSVESIIGEIEECINKYNILWFYFFSDTFTLKKEQVIELCKKIIDKKLNIKFWGNSRVDTFDEEMAKYLKEAGCKFLAFGIESGNQKTLDKIKKRIKLEQSKRAIQICRKYGIESNAFVILGFPWETKREIDNTIKFTKEIDPDYAQFFTPIPFPGTELLKLYEEENFIANPDVFDNFQTCVVRTSDLSAEQLRKIVKKANLGFYMRPKKIISLVKKERISTFLHAGIPILLNRLRK